MRVISSLGKVNTTDKDTVDAQQMLEMIGSITQSINTLNRGIMLVMDIQDKQTRILESLTKSVTSLADALNKQQSKDDNSEETKI